MADRKQDDLAPENHNSEQDDEQEQTQSVADEALHKDRESPLDSGKHKSEADLSDDSTQDLVASILTPSAARTITTITRTSTAMRPRSIPTCRPTVAKPRPRRASAGRAHPTPRAV